MTSLQKPELELIPKVPFSFDTAQNLLSLYGSPLYVYDHQLLIDTIITILQSIPYHNTKFQFAAVTNGNIALLKILKSQNWGLHANTPGDIFLGLTAGFLPIDIVYSGSNLNEIEMETILRWGVKTLNLDSLSQVQLCCQVYQSLSSKLTPPKLGLRLNSPDLTGDSRIGIFPEEFAEVIQIAKQGGLKIQGLHFYRGTGTNATTAFTHIIEKILAIGQLLPDWEYLDFGGGFGYPYRHQGVAFDWQLFGQEMTQALNQFNPNLQLIIEPGRSVIAGCASLLAQVVSVKWQGEKQILGVDTTIANLAVLTVHGGYRKIVTWTHENDQFCLTDVCGNTTYSRDYLGKNCQLPALKIGDIVAILEVGAYGYAMSSHFLHRPRPAEVLLTGDKHQLIRQREDYHVLLNHQIWR